jgi:N utilization substance protein B
MNRHYARVVALQALYEGDFRDNKDFEKTLDRHLDNIDDDGENCDFARELLVKTAREIDSIDKKIEEVAPDWPISQVAIIDRNILRVSICEILYFKTPPKVVINEAIEMAKTFGSETSSKFVNGVLGTIYRKCDRYEDEKQND